MKFKELDECPDSVWMPYMVGNDVPIVPRGESHPVAAGIYFLFTEDKGLFYIGMSLNLSIRTAQHTWGGKRIGYVGAIDVPNEWIDIVETAYIDALQPPVNKKYARTIHQPIHDKMVSVIKGMWGLG